MESRSKGFIVIAILFTIVIIGMITYGILLSTSDKSKEFVKEKLNLDKEIEVKIDKKKKVEKKVKSEEVSQSIIHHLDELSDAQKAVLDTLKAESYFNNFPSNMTLFQEIKLAQQINKSFLIELRMTSAKIVFSDQLDSEAILQIKYYQKSEDGSNLEYEFLSEKLKLGLKPNVLDLPANIRIRAFVILPLLFEELFLEASGSDYQLEANNPLICNELVFNTKAANGQINLAKLTTNKLHVVVNAAGTNLTIDELELNDELKIKNNAAKLTSHINKVTGTGETIEVTQNISQSNLVFKNLKNYLLRGDIKLGSVDVNLSDKTESYSKSFTLKDGDGKLEIKIELLLGEVNITF
ncbi:MAG: hypothetical protein MJB14_09290 [Spirochaetes bacterium]|nr:hypothetical protein [Spirochaetota bacterium]